MKSALKMKVARIFKTVEFEQFSFSWTKEAQFTISFKRNLIREETKNHKYFRRRK